MKRISPWKLGKNAARTIGALGVSAVLSGCVMMPMSAVNGSAAPGSDKIVAGCVWPGFGQQVTYATASGDLYQVEAYGSSARIQASLMGGGVIVRASYDAMAPVFLGPGSLDGLRFYEITAYSPMVTPPSQLALATAYAFGSAARMALNAFEFDRRELPTAICPPTVRVDGFYRASALPLLGPRF